MLPEANIIITIMPKGNPYEVCGYFFPSVPSLFEINCDVGTRSSSISINPEISLFSELGAGLVSGLGAGFVSDFRRTLFCNYCISGIARLIG